jgi:hypothetical protein
MKANESLSCYSTGNIFELSYAAAMSNNPFSDNNPYQSPQTPLSQQPPPQSPFEEGDATGGVIPYKNPQALIAYYLGIVALFPCLGFPFGIASLILGIRGLKAYKLNPRVHGVVHAWIGIVLGALSIFFYGGGILLTLILAATGNMK